MVNSNTDKMTTYFKVIVSVVLMFYVLLMISPPAFNPVLLTLLALWIFMRGPLALTASLKAYLFITHRGISLVTASTRQYEPYISWKQLINVEIHHDHASGISKVVVYGQYEPQKNGQTTILRKRIVIPGHNPDILRIVNDLREIAPDKVSDINDK
ncbi:MAG: hypothetical protein ACYC1M_19320 [Armatimonadota bacterium]